MIICLTRSTVKNVHNFRPLFLVLFFSVYLLFFWSLSPHFAAKVDILVIFFLLFLNDLVCFFSFFPTIWHVFFLFSQRIGMFFLSLLARYILDCVWKNDKTYFMFMFWWDVYGWFFFCFCLLFYVLEWNWITP